MSEQRMKLSRSAVGRAAGASQSSGFLRLFGGSVTVQATGQFLRRHLWAWPLIAAVILGGVGWWVNHSVESALRQQRIDELTALLNADVAALEAWMADEISTAKVMSLDERLLPLVQELLTIANDPKGGRERTLVASKAQADLRTRLKPRLDLSDHCGFFLVSADGVVLAADLDAPVGMSLAGYRKEVFDKALSGQTTVSKPYRSPLLLTDAKGVQKVNLPTMFVAVPLRDDKGNAIAALGLRIRPDDSFTKILQVARYGETGETYAFDKTGLLLSQSRFDDDMKKFGLLLDQPDNSSILTVEVRNPEADLSKGERAAKRRAEQPLTELAAAAIKHETVSGYNVDGYRDYRGAPSVGAWKWLDDADFGVITEVDTAEAFHAVYILRRAIWTLMALLLVAAIGIFAAMIFIARQQKTLQKVALTAKQLGQYALEEKIGAGGMGSVYKARHAMLRRPTAVKLLDVDKMTDAAVTRFEREVQLTSALTHPNTVAIYDYGRIPDGIFYYAMEYLDGMNLDELVRCFGAVPEARVVYILRQICGGLAEAHEQGLVHRDIKPANIFLTIRGGLRDFVKVLDFGLVKALEGSDQANLTAANAITGTPLYISPEAVQHPEQVDARSDVYGIGAVAYFLLTGQPPFTGTTVMEICLHHVRTPAEPPSQRVHRTFSADLEALVMRCLAKSRDERPADASALLADLDGCILSEIWTADNAKAWWSANAASVGTAASSFAATKTAPDATKVNQPSMDVTMGYEVKPS